MMLESVALAQEHLLPFLDPLLDNCFPCERTLLSLFLRHLSRTHLFFMQNFIIKSHMGAVSIASDVSCVFRDPGSIFECCSCPTRGTELLDTCDYSLSTCSACTLSVDPSVVARPISLGGDEELLEDVMRDVICHWI